MTCRLVDLKGRADTIAADAAAANTKLRTRLDQIKTRLDALGAAPAEGQPPEASMVTEERSRLTAERAEVNAIAGEVESTATNAAQISNNITAVRRALFAATLFKRTEVSSQTLGDASSAFVSELTNLNNAFSRLGGFRLELQTPADVRGGDAVDHGGAVVSGGRLPLFRQPHGKAGLYRRAFLSAAAFGGLLVNHGAVAVALPVSGDLGVFPR